MERKERGFWDLLPRRNFRRALFLVLALLGVLVIKRTGGGAFRNLLDAVAPAPPAAPAGPGSAPGRAEPPFRRIEVRPPSNVAPPAGHP